MYPPLLKKNLASLPPSNVTVCVAVTDTFQLGVYVAAVVDSVMLPSLFNLFVYSVLMSVARLAITAIASPDDTENDEMFIVVP